jgi:hypothetical protein
MTSIIPFRRRKLANATAVGRFSGRLGTERIIFIVPFSGTGVFFDVVTGDGESWRCVVRSKLVRPILASFRAGDPVSVCGHIWVRPLDIGGETRDAHGVYAIDKCPADFPWGQGLRLW